MAWAETERELSTVMATAARKRKGVERVSERLGWRREAREGTKTTETALGGLPPAAWLDR